MGDWGGGEVSFEVVLDVVSCLALKTVQFVILVFHFIALRSLD